MLPVAFPCSVLCFFAKGYVANKQYFRRVRSTGIRWLFLFEIASVAQCSCKHFLITVKFENPRKRPSLN
jgi:hypothetical protein